MNKIWSYYLEHTHFNSQMEVDKKVNAYNL